MGLYLWRGIVGRLTSLSLSGGLELFEFIGLDRPVRAIVTRSQVECLDPAFTFGG